MEDLGSSDILVLDGDASGACGVGIESTVAKIDVENDRILILRMGGVTQERIRQALREGGDYFSGISVHAGSVAGGKTGAKAETEQDEGGSASSPNGPSEAEGQAPGKALCSVCLLRAELAGRQQSGEPVMYACTCLYFIFGTLTGLEYFLAEFMR